MVYGLLWVKLTANRSYDMAFVYVLVMNYPKKKYWNAPTQSDGLIIRNPSKDGVDYMSNVWNCMFFRYRILPIPTWKTPFFHFRLSCFLKLDKKHTNWYLLFCTIFSVANFICGVVPSLVWQYVFVTSYLTGSVFFTKSSMSIRTLLLVLYNLIYFVTKSGLSTRTLLLVIDNLIFFVTKSSMSIRTLLLVLYNLKVLNFIGKSVQ